MHGFILNLPLKFSENIIEIYYFRIHLKKSIFPIQENTIMSPWLKIKIGTWLVFSRKIENED